MTDKQITDGIIYTQLLNEFFGRLRAKVLGVMIKELEYQIERD